MGRKRITLDQVIEAMDGVVDGYPQGADARVSRSGSLGGRYVEHGEPCCLVGVILIRFGASVATLKDLDREDEEIKDSAHPYWKRFDPVALELLSYLQRQNDGGASWELARERAFTANKYWQRWIKPGERLYQERVYPGPWCTDENARH
jgi:hypothetical protein